MTETTVRPGAWLGLSLAALLAACAPGPGGETPTPAAPAATLPAPGETVEERLEAGAALSYEASLEAGETLHLSVEQLGSDVEVSLLDPAGEAVLTADSPTGDRGREELFAVAETAGLWRVKVHAFPSQPTGAYRLTVAARRPAAESDRARAAAARRLAAGQPEEVLRLAREAGDAFLEGEALDRLARAAGAAGRQGDAAALFEQARDRFRASGHPVREALGWLQVGTARFRGDDFEAAAAAYREALPRLEAVGHRQAAATTLHNLGHTDHLLGQPRQAVDAYQRALALRAELGLADARATTLHNLGVLLREMGELERAEDLLTEAEQTYHRLGDDRRRAGTLDELGQLARRRGEPGRALKLYGEALALRRALGDERGEAVTRTNLAVAQRQQGEAEMARATFLEALAVFQQLGDGIAEGRVRRNLASLDADQGRLQEALAGYRKALDLDRRLDHPAGLAEVLFEIAAVRRRLGDLDAAHAAAEEGLAVFESLRARAAAHDLRASYLATLQGRYDFLIGVLMDLHRRDPAAGWDARALEVSERGRARSLLELLTEAGARVRLDANPELLAREEELQRQLNALARRQAELAGQGAAGEALPGLGRKIREQAAALERLRADLRTASPRWAALARPRPLAAAEIRRQVLDPETVLLEIHLGRERSFAWVLSREGLTSYEMPPAAQVEALARRAHELLAASTRRETRPALAAALCELSRRLLEPAAEALAGKRLLVAAEGALAYLPFAALPEPGGPPTQRRSEPQHHQPSFPPLTKGGLRGDFLGSQKACAAAEPLVAHHEVVHLPSASALAALRRAWEGRPPAPREVAVVADPVFSADDERLPTAVRRAAAGGLRRLAESRREADAVLALAPPEESLALLGFEAGREAVLGGRLGGYRVVHFATHGVLDSERPELSGLALSRLDRQGRPREGFVYAHEIYGLTLPADLVTLSACRTALGREIRGEGLVGLARGFLYAGARRVLVSLWRVGDRSTAELMERFYRALLVEGQEPAAALQAAQRSMRAEPRWEAPAHWAGFVLQGDWPTPSKPNHRMGI